jgi:hypothetical protein
METGVFYLYEQPLTNFFYKKTMIDFSSKPIINNRKAPKMAYKTTTFRNVFTLTRKIVFAQEESAPCLVVHLLEEGGDASARHHAGSSAHSLTHVPRGRNYHI